MTNTDDLFYERRAALLMRDCDRFSRLKPSAILTMFQDCTESLTERWGVGLRAMLARGAIWVAARAECEVISRVPRHGEIVRLRGWAGRSRTGIYPYHYELADDDGALLLTGCSLWALSDLEAHSMMGPNVPKLSLPTPEPEGSPLPRLRPVRPPAERQRTTRRVRFSETDINGHLTNTRYVDWACDLAPASFHERHAMRSLRMDYRAEIFPEEEVALEWSLAENSLWCSAPGRFSAQLDFEANPM